MRRAGGAVRDLDVQRKLLLELGEATDGVRDEVDRMRRILKKRRRKQAAKLVGTLAHRQAKLLRRLEVVTQALEAAEESNAPLEQGSREIVDWYRARVPDRAQARQDSTGDEQERLLHNVRKSAKLARYMAEARGDAQCAEEFEALQEAGGRWHDFLLLERVVAGRSGESSPLVSLLRQRCNRALRVYREALDGFNKRIAA